MALDRTLVGAKFRDMNIEQSVDILRSLVTTSLTVASPILIAAVTVGVVVSLLQAVTSIQEASLAFIPKVTALGITMVVVAPWILRILMDFTIVFLNRLPEATQ
jgi:flagellar biosynthetic protein FliQ